MNNLSVIIISLVGLLGAIGLASVMPYVMGLVLGISIIALILGLNAVRFASFSSFGLLMCQGLLPLPTLYIAFFIVYIGLSFFRTIRSTEEDTVNSYMDSSECTYNLLALIKAEWQHKTYIFVVGILMLAIMTLFGVPGLLARYATTYTPLLLKLSLPVSLLVWGIYFFCCVEKDARVVWLGVSITTALQLVMVSIALEGSMLASLAVLGPLMLLSKSKLDKGKLKQLLNINEEEVLAAGYESSLSARTTLVVLLSNLFAFTSQSALLAIKHKEDKVDSTQAKINAGFVGAISEVVCLFILILLGLVRGDMDMMGRLTFLPTMGEWVSILLIALALVLLIGCSFNWCFKLYKRLHTAEGLIKVERLYQWVLIAISVFVMVIALNSLLVLGSLIFVFTLSSKMISKDRRVSTGTVAAIPVFILTSGII